MEKIYKWCIMIEHKHIIIRALVNKPLKTEDEAKLWWNDLVKEIGMVKLDLPENPICGYVDTPGNAGITIVGIIETSHIAMHIWDEQSPALVQLDVYTCSSLPKDKVHKMLEFMDPVKVEWATYDREHTLEKIDDGNR